MAAAKNRYSIRETFSRMFSFTDRERGALILVIAALTLSLFILMFSRTTPSDTSYDYSASDAAFERLSSVKPALSHDDSVRTRFLNTMSAKELMEISGIGPALSSRIIDYRQESGPFTEPEDLLEVSGIGEKRFETVIKHIDKIRKK